MKNKAIKYIANIVVGWFFIVNPTITLTQMAHLNPELMGLGVHSIIFS